MKIGVLSKELVHVKRSLCAGEGRELKGGRDFDYLIG
jgi:hypothetical protein